jgi:hypothetical protein
MIWGCESWNLKKKLNKLRSFHHGAIKRILHIKCGQVREKHIKNSKVRAIFFNIPNINTFISKRTAKYIGKIARGSDCSLPKKFLTAWINKPRKNGAPQYTCNDNFVKAINDILPCNLNLSRNAPLKEWLPLAKNEKKLATLMNILNHAEKLTKVKMKVRGKMIQMTSPYKLFCLSLFTSVCQK